ncbi:thiosulfate oxidation carrier protein SoxY [Puniceibacterium sediminis]|uniref:Sulfur-oxidizing protein SoxY n=1 Tax=Puniceibacterium sediminis TaxID=1608407 RepID=A0A238V0K3_9RHOB|nr:thiosulfate oxidation carrier protein SoxY [Puniceibacterium sediminis]SNR27768.1 sulfur-oxidizing protein SoxY [Puniceibacterium sediminis]
MDFTRRETLALGAGAALMSFLPMRANAEAVDDLIAAFTGGAEMGDAGVDLNAPEIAENGNTVPVEVSAPGAKAILLLAAGNPTPPVAQFNFGPLAGSQTASTRIRLAGTQDLIAIAQLGDGTFARTSKTVKVTIGGCGG